MKHLPPKTTYRYLLLVIFSVITYMPSAGAKVPSWHVQPKVCIVENLGDTCEMVLTLNIQNLAPGNYCYYQGQTQLSCWTGLPRQNTLVVRFIEDTILYLKSANGSVILSHKMGIKARASKKQVRRVRQPWSLF